MIIIAFCFGLDLGCQTEMCHLSSSGTGESITLPDGIQFVSIECTDCDIIHAGDTINITSVFTFPDYPLESYTEIIIESNVNSTKIAYRYANY